MEEIKRESDVLRYNLMKFDLVYLKSILKMRLNLGNITKWTWMIYRFYPWFYLFKIYIKNELVKNIDDLRK
jgi:hypothetical protein